MTRSRQNWCLHAIDAVKYSVQGLISCFKHELAFRQECMIAIPHFVAVALLPMELWMRFYLGALWVVVIVVELVNTGIEAVTDLASPEWHQLAKKAKDCGSAAVFCTILLFSLSWLFVLIRMAWRITYG